MSGGTISKLHNDLGTDRIIASQYPLLPTIDKMKVHTSESLGPDFPQKVKKGDCAVGGENFGCSSSGEQAPSILKALGVKAVATKSFTKTFYRSSINTGSPVIMYKEPPDEVETRDTMGFSLSEGVAQTNRKKYPCTRLPECMQNILNQGGLIASLNKEGVQPWE